MTATATSVHGRRWFLVQASTGVLGFAVLGLAAACSGDDGDETDVAGALAPSGSAAGLDWWRVDFAYVSAYVLVRDREAALVDYGLGSRVDELEAVLKAAGTGGDRVRHVLVAHAHGDHYEGLIQVAGRSPDAALCAGAADAGPIRDFSGRQLRPTTDGQEVFGLVVVDTPGHLPATSPSSIPTRGCSSPETLSNNTIDGLKGPMPEYTMDQPTAEESVRKLADLEPQVILFGHGPPVQRDAAAQLRRLASAQ